jgi:hypothetical protein
MPLGRSSKIWIYWNSVDHTRFWFMLMMHNIKIASKCFEIVTEFKYLKIIVTKQNYITDEIWNRFNVGNVCYH